MFNLQTIKNIASVLGCGLIFAIAAFGQTTAFTYQGRFTDSTAPQPTNGSYEMQFKLYTTAGINTGTQVGETQTVPAVQVVNGVFTVQLDAENSFRSGADLFVEISVRPAGSSASPTKLAPRQQVTSAPYAVQSRNALTATLADAANKLGGVAGQLANHQATAGNNTFFGYRAGAANSADANNTVVGAQTGQTNLLGAGNALFGFNAKGGGDNNLVAGTEANALGSRNTLLGCQANADGSNNTIVGSQASAAGGIVNSTAIGYQTFVNASNTIVLGTNSEETRIPGKLSVFGKIEVGTLGAAGSTSLCLNSAFQISTCTAGHSPEKDQNQTAAFSVLNQQNLELKAQFERQQKQIAEQSEKNKQLQTQIDDLRKLFCGLNPAATVCAQ